MTPWIARTCFVALAFARAAYAQAPAFSPGDKVIVQVINPYTIGKDRPFARGVVTAYDPNQYAYNGNVKVRLDETGQERLFHESEVFGTKGCNGPVCVGMKFVYYSYDDDQDSSPSLVTVVSAGGVWGGFTNGQGRNPFFLVENAKKGIRNVGLNALGFMSGCERGWCVGKRVVLWYPEGLAHFPDQKVVRKDRRPGTYELAQIAAVFHLRAAKNETQTQRLAVRLRNGALDFVDPGTLDFPVLNADGCVSGLCAGQKVFWKDRRRVGQIIGLASPQNYAYPEFKLPRYLVRFPAGQKPKLLTAKQLARAS